jgi:hypothetical protein
MKRQLPSRKELEGPPSRIDVYATWIAEDAPVETSRLSSRAKRGISKPPKAEIPRVARSDKR